MRSFAIAVAAVLSVVALAGCADPPRAAALTSAPVVPTVDADQGSIAGTVSDDEGRPLPAVEVALVERGDTQSTNESGRFVFNGLEPGSYRVVLQRLGFQSVARKVDVLAGEVTEVRIVLPSLLVSNETFQYVLPRTSIIHLGPAFLYSWVVAAANNSNLNGLFCDPCYQIIHFPASPGFGLTEATWPGANPCPGVNCEVWIFYKSKWTNAHSLSDGELAFSGNFKDRMSIPWSKTATSLLKGKDHAMLVASNGVVYPNVELKVTTWTSFSYNGEFPDNYTALPPK